MEDPQLRADAQTLRLAIDPIYGEEAQLIIQRLYASPPDVVERTAQDRAILRAVGRNCFIAPLGGKQWITSGRR